MKTSNHTVEDFKNLPSGSLIYYYSGDQKVYGLFVEILPNDYFNPVYAYWGYYIGGGTYTNWGYYIGGGTYTNPEVGVNLGWMDLKHVFIDQQKELKIIEDPQFKNMYI